MTDELELDKDGPEAAAGRFFAPVARPVRRLGPLGDLARQPTWTALAAAPSPLLQLSPRAPPVSARISTGTSIQA